MSTIQTTESLAVKIESLEQTDRRLGSDVHNLRSDMNTGFQQLNANIQQLASKMDANQHTSWSSIAAWVAVSVSIVTVVGTIGISPIYDRIGKLENFAEKDGITTAVESRLQSLRETLDAYQKNTAETRSILIGNITERIDRIDYYGTARSRIYNIPELPGGEPQSAPHPEISKGARDR